MCPVLSGFLLVAAPCRLAVGPVSAAGAILAPLSDRFLAPAPFCNRRAGQERQGGMAMRRAQPNRERRDESIRPDPNAAEAGRSARSACFALCWVGRPGRAADRINLIDPRRSLVVPLRFSPICPGCG
jgi:hypothetical protein